MSSSKTTPEKVYPGTAFKKGNKPDSPDLKYPAQAMIDAEKKSEKGGKTYPGRVFIDAESKSAVKIDASEATGATGATGSSGSTGAASSGSTGATGPA